MPDDSTETDASARPVDLALQGGGAHGAFTWGVLDRILARPDIRIESVSGTSAGAMNAVLLAHGYRIGGREGASAALANFWRSVSDAALFSPLRRTPMDMMMGNWSLDRAPGYVFFDLMSRLFSPYEMNPANLNPLRGILESQVDFDGLKASPIRLFVNATNVRTGAPRVFRNADLTVDAVLASACLPLVHQAIEIDGDAYWDGGFSGNPLLIPLLRESAARDLIIVQINPIERPGVPRTAREILNRMNEISFNAALKKDLRGMAVFRRLLAEGAIPPEAEWVADVMSTRIHRITTPKFAEFTASSKLNAEWEFLTLLQEEGQRAADGFMAEHGDDLGQRSSYDIDGLLDTIWEQI